MGLHPVFSDEIDLIFWLYSVSLWSYSVRAEIYSTAKQYIIH